MATKEVFLSYKEEEGDLAGNVKECFEQLGWEVFLAHEDIRPTEEWRAEILKHLDTCSALVTIVTPDFRNSEWTNQEVGIAIGKSKPIVSLIFNGTNNLPGFLESFQGIRVSPDQLEKAVNEAQESIADKGSATVNAIYIQLAASLRKLVNRWESYRNVTETIGRSAESIKNLQRSYRTISDELLDLVSTKESEIESGVVHQARVLFDQMQTASFMDIGSLPDIFDDQIREVEKPAEAAYGTARALLRYLADIKKIA
jgi:uncharacterized membrane-anchored protein YhcB (DUF1043 family)